MWSSRYTAIVGAGIIAALSLGTIQNASAASPSQPTYTPFYTADFESNTVGSTIQEFANSSTPAKLSYSDDVVGPLGGQLTARQENQMGNKNFGGKIVDTQLGKGKEIWVRWYEYFPTSYCFANGTNGDSNGGAGKMKWMRFQYPSNTSRITLELDGTPSCTAPCTNCLTHMSVDSIIGEAMGWNNIKRVISSDGFPRGQWHALQVYMYLDNVPANAGGNARIRVWVDNKFLTEINDVPTLGSASDYLASVYWGNYWNGGFPLDQHWYMDEVIMTTSRPDSTDSGGRYYIDPQTRVADFGVPPNPPSGIN